MAIGAETNVKWVDGLRGLASVLVVITHVYRQFDDPVFDAAMGENQPMRWDQWPFMSFAGRGRIGVTIFAFVTGYVCALKPIKLFRAGNQEGAFTSISKSAIRRFPRLMLPAAAATVVAWILAELGLYTVLKHSDNDWLAFLAHDRVGTFSGAIYELLWQICKTWVQRENNYDNNQWTMLELLQESYTIYIFLIAVAYLKPKWRMASALLMMLYEWVTKEAVFELLGFFGVFIAEIQIQPSTAAFIETHRLACHIAAAALMFVGLYVGSFPERHWEWAEWSRNLHDFEAKILPENPDFPRFSTGIGLILIVIAIIIVPRLQRLLSSKYLLWLGRHSFAVYLLHMQVFKTVWTWLLYGFSIKPDHLNDKGEPEITRLVYPGHTWMFITMVPVLMLTYTCAYYWALYVDPYCERLVNKLIEHVKLDTNKESASYLPRPVS